MKNRIELGLDDVTNRLRPNSLYTASDRNQAFLSAKTDRLNISGKVFQSNINFSDSNATGRFDTNRYSHAEGLEVKNESTILAKHIK